jgi:hypothetical protein
MRLTDHVTLNFNNNMPMAAVFLGIEKTFGTTRYSGLLHKLSKFEFSASLIKLISSFLSQRKYTYCVLVESEMSIPSEMQARVPQGSILYIMHINDAPDRPGVHLTLFADDTCLYATIRKEGFVVRKLHAVGDQWRPGVSVGILK